MTNTGKTTLYLGVTNNIPKRIREHKNTIGFANKYKCFTLVYYEHFTQIEHAIQREKQLKKWNRVKKIELIEKLNPEQKDILDQLI